MKKLGLLAFLLAGQFVFTSVSGQDDPSMTQVVNELYYKAIVMRSIGYVQSHVAVIGELFQNGSKDITADLRADVPYAFIAACDIDCNNIDLELYDEQGAYITADTDPDDGPLVGFQPNNNTTVRIRVSMPACNANSCVYGVAIFRQGPTNNTQNVIPP